MSARALERFRRLIGEAIRLGFEDQVSVTLPARVGDPPPWLAPLLKLQGEEPLRTYVAVACDGFEKAMDDDFNTPKAVAAISGLRRSLEIHRTQTGPGQRPEPFINAVTVMVLLGRSLGMFERAAQQEGLPAGIESLVTEREAARRGRNWKRADELREEIHRLGWTVEDTPGGPRVLRRAKQGIRRD